MPEKKIEKGQENMKQRKREKSVESISVKIIYGENELTDCMESVIRLHIGNYCKEI